MLLLARGLGWRSPGWLQSFARGCGCSWCLRVAALWRLPWLIRYRLIVLRSSIAIYSSLTCSLPSPPSWFLQPEFCTGSFWPIPFFHSNYGSMQESWVSMLVQVNLVFHSAAAGYQVDKLHDIFLHYCALFQHTLSLQASFSCSPFQPELILISCVWWCGFSLIGVLCFPLVCFCVVLGGFPPKRNGIWLWESILKFPCESWDRVQLFTKMNALHFKGQLPW